MSSPPNVLLILTDDQGWDDVGFHGNTLIETPNLDALATKSVRFNHFYATPVCAPTRAGLLTGRHYLRTGVCHVHGGRDFMHPDEVTMAQWFQANGYATGMWGKWHSGKTSGYFPWERGFDEAYMAQLYKHQDSVGHFNGEARSHTGWTVDTLTDYALDFIQRKKDMPFFAFLPYLTVHAPLVAPANLVGKYAQKGMSETLATVYAMVEQLDTNIGRLMNTLTELDLLDNTIVIFLTDNGPQYFGTQRMSAEDYAKRYPSMMKGHKGSMWENGIRVPCLVHWPMRFAAHQVERVADIYDLLPTLISVCGLKETPDNVLPFDGRDIGAYLEGKDDLPDKTHVIFSNIGWPPIKAQHQLAHIQREEYTPVAPAQKAQLPFDTQLIGLRTETHKLLRNPGYAEGAPAAFGDEVLIHIAEDPLEDENLAARDENRAAEMRQSLAAWFDALKAEPHAYHIPRFAIGPGMSNVLYFYAPLRRLGNTWNGGLVSYNWSTSGDGGEYLIQVTKAGKYRVQLRAREHQEAAVTLRFELDGEFIYQAIVDVSKADLGTLSLPSGDHTLRVVVDDDNSESSLTLVDLRFEPVEKAKI